MEVIIIIYLILAFLIFYSLFKLIKVIIKLIKNDKLIQINLKSEIYIPFFILVINLCAILYFGNLISISGEDHHDVKKGTSLWKYTMNEKVVESFPIIENTSQLTYNYFCGNNPNFAAAWEINYFTDADTNYINQNVLKYLKKNDFVIKRNAKSELTDWEIRDINDNSTIYYYGNVKTTNMNKCYSITVQITNCRNEWTEVYAFISL